MYYPNWGYSLKIRRRTATLKPKSSRRQPAKCIAFTKKERELPAVDLCGVPLPWVSGGVHLGNHVSNSCDGMRQDIRVRRANFINKNIELNQDLFLREAIMIESSWNTAVRIMFDLPFQKHRNLIEPFLQDKASDVCTN